MLGLAFDVLAQIVGYLPGEIDQTIVFDRSRKKFAWLMTFDAHVLFPFLHVVENKSCKGV